MLRESIKFIIEQEEDLKVVGCAKDGMEALELCDSLHPDIVLMDIVMPVCDGIEGTRLIKAKHSKIKIIVLTTFHDDENISRVLKNGADGYVLKDVSPSALRLSIRSVMEGMPIIHQKVFNSVVNRIDEVTVTDITGQKPDDIILSEKEQEIIKLIVQGKSNKDIASAIYLSDGRVRNIISGILDKLDLKDRTQLAVYAVKNRLV